MKLRDLFKGTNVIPPRIDTPEWHPLDELDDEVIDMGYLSLPAEVQADIEANIALVAGQCTAPTKTGKPCSKPPRPGSDRCTLPAHQRA